MPRGKPRESYALNRRVIAAPASRMLRGHRHGHRGLGGLNKTTILAGVLRARLCSVLVIDEVSARAALGILRGTTWHFDVSRHRHRHVRASRPSSWTTMTRPVATASAPLTVSRPRPLWSEQDPRGLVAGGRRQRSTPWRPKRRRRWRPCAAIGLSGQMLGVTLLDAADTPIRPALLWNDGRASAECAELDRCFPDFADIVGCRAHAGLLRRPTARGCRGTSRRPWRARAASC